MALGVDIGLSGGLALLTAEGELVAVEDMPVLRDGPKGRPTVNPALLAAILNRWRPSRAFVEHVAARPAEGPTGAFAFGRARGCIEGVLGALAIPVTFLTPATWKRTVGLPPGADGAKDRSRGEAIRRWPAHAALFSRACDDGRAEGCLIAIAGLRREARS